MRTATNFARMVEGINRSRLGIFVEGGLGPIIEAHKLMAEDASISVARVLEERIADTGRPQKESNNLVRAIKEPGNHFANRDGFVIGGEALARDPLVNPYFRGLEEGSRVFVGREIAGFFISPGGALSGPSGDRFRQDLTLGQIGRTFGSKVGNLGSPDRPIPTSSFFNSAGKLNVVTKRSQQSTFGAALRSDGSAGPDAIQNPFGAGRQAQNGSSRPTNFGHRILIKNPIPAYRYFFEGGKQWLASDNAEQIYAQLLQGIPGVRVNGKAV